MDPMERFGTTPDLYDAVNNGVLAIWPTRSGRLKDLVKSTKSGDERCWIFADSGSLTDADGDEIVNHHRRGVVCGSWEDGQGFVKMCIEEFDLRVKSNGYSGNGAGFVPLSNGERASGTLRNPGPNSISRLASDWDPAELKRVRIDLPTHTMILVVLGRKD